MNTLLVLVPQFLTFIKTYCFLPLVIVLAVWGTLYGVGLWEAAWADIRNSGTDVRGTIRIVQQIRYERWSRRDPRTMAFYAGTFSIIALLILSLIYG